MKITKPIFDQYLKGQCSPEQQHEIERLLQKNPHLLENWIPKNDWEESKIDDTYPSEQTILARIKKRKEAKLYYRKTLKWSTAAAAMLIAVYSLSQLFTNSSNIDSSKDQIANSIKQPAKPTTPNLYYINSGNENIVVKASDGSTITIFPQSEVRFAEDFSSLDERKIEMKGKVTFKVAKNKLKPFKVYSADIITVALGTMFTVEEIKAEETDIQLHEGSIEVSMENVNLRNQFKRIIKPQESIVINHTRGQVVKEIKVPTTTTDRSGYFHHNDKTIKINNLAVIDILKNLELNYNLHFQYDESLLKNKFFSGTFKTNSKTYITIINEINYLHNVNIALK